MSRQSGSSAVMTSSSAIGRGNQWCSAEREVGSFSRDAPTGLSEELDLRVENERKLNEMREQGRQVLLQREEQGGSEEGAANLLARFHNLHWKRQHHLETNSSQQVCGNGKVLVPVKREEEEEYFRGIRQPKKVRPKNTKKKPETVSLEEVSHKPKTILPAGYQPSAPSTNAWALRRGTDLFEHCKVSLTIHGPDDTDEVLQRALEESLITLREEQSRIVNMYSGSCSASEDKKQSKAPWKPLPNEMLDSWSDTSNSNTGAGDGAWMQGNTGSSQPAAARKQFADAVEDEESKKHKFGVSLPENSSYNSRSRSLQSRQHKLRSMNGVDEGSLPSEKLGVEKNMEKESCDTYGKPRLQPETKALRFDAGDGYHNGPHERETNNSLQELGKRTEKDDHLESLGFSKTRSGGHRKSTHRGIENKQGNSIRRGATVQDDGKRKTDTRVDNSLHNRRSRHVSFSDPLERPCSGRSSAASTPEEEDDPDPWCESQEEPIYPSQVSSWNSQEKSETRNSPVIQSQHSLPQRTVRERESTITGNQTYRAPVGFRGTNRSTTGVATYKSMWNSAQENGKHPAQDLSSKSREKTEETKAKSGTAVETLEKQGNKIKVLEESSQFMKKPSDGVGESKKISNVDNEEIKKIREQIQMLDCKLRSLSTALGDSSPPCGSTVDCSMRLTSDNCPVQFLPSSDSNRSQVPIVPGTDSASMAAYVANLQQQQQQMAQQHLAQQQHLILQGAVAAACPSAFSTHPMALNWMAQAGPAPVQTNPDWLAQMGMGASGAPPAVSGTLSNTPAAPPQDVASVPRTTIPSSIPTAPPGLPAPAQNMAPSGMPTAVGADSQAMTAHAQWMAQYSAWQQQEQQRMAHIMAQRMPPIPGMPMPPHAAMPMPMQMQQPLNCGVGRAAWPNVGSFNPQYEGDWVISPSELARLEQRPPPGSKEGESNNSSAEPNSSQTKGQQHSTVISNNIPDFPDPALSPTGSVRALGIPLPAALKPARPPMHLAGLKIQAPNMPASGVRSQAPLDLSAFNPRMPPPEAPKGLKQNNTQLDEPRGRGRLR